MNTYIARPEFNNDRLADPIHWFEDNALLLAQFAHERGLTMDTNDHVYEYGRFLRAQWQHEVKYNDPSKPECSICRRRHGYEVTHECE